MSAPDGFDHEFLVLVQRYRREESAAATAKIKELRDLVDTYEAQAVRAEALLEGMTSEAKRRAERAVRLEDALLRAHAHHMFGVDVDGPPADRVGALYYLRAHGLPEATPADLDAACEGLETPWGSGPATGKGQVECPAGPRFDAEQVPVRTSYVSINTDSSFDVVIDGQTVSRVYHPTPPDEDIEF